VPELPEVETMARDIRPTLAGAVIRAVRVYRPDILRRIRRPAFESALTGRRVRAVGRRAKHVVIELDDGRRVVVQPRMTGSFGVTRSGRSRRRGPDALKRTLGKARPAGLAQDPYICVELELASGFTVFYRDVRRLGVIYLLDQARWETYDRAMGPEPLDPSFTPDVLAGILRLTKAAVKKAIMDQKRLVGVGNIYASEALWMAGIDPSKASHRVPAGKVAPLHDAIVDVLRASIDGRGTTIRDYRTGTGEPGNFAGRLAVYDRAGEPCLRCGKRIALTHAIDGRASYFCPGCQR
jgi:formamidopyrimidine-DNA glycosylase